VKTNTRIQRGIAAIVPLAFAASAIAQSAIYSNASADPAVPALATGDVTLSGVGAPSGFVWSEAPMQAGVANAVGGFSTHLSGTSGEYRFADDFTVTGPQGWIVSRVTVFAYQNGAAVGLSPFTGATLRIWNGPPGDAGSDVVFGDTATNRLLSSSATNIYRVFNTSVVPAATPDQSRVIFANELDAGGVLLAPGVYWLDWQISTSVLGGEAFSPPATIAGLRTQAGWNALQLGAEDGVFSSWKQAFDPGKPASGADVAADLPFIITGFGGTLPCNADFDGDGDTGTDADIEAFFACLGGNCCVTCGSADFNADGDVGTDADIEAFFRVLAGGAC
jgi:hypothetical protein